MSRGEVQIIKGGWGNVPSNLKCRSDLKEIGLVPKNQNKYVALVWNSYDWIQLYDIADCRPKRKPSEKQLAALRKGQAKLKEMLTCSQCGEYVHFRQNIVGDICRWCYENNKWRAEQEAIREEYESMINAGKSFFAELFSKDFVILDTETTGLYDAEIIELSIIDKEGNVLFDSLFKPKHPIPDEVIEIHGIDNEMVAAAPTWAEKISEIKRILEGKTVVIYNAEFDCNMIHSTNRIWKMEDHISFTAACAMEGYRMYCGSERWCKLSEASGEYTAHRALNDCYSVLTLCNNAWSELNLIEANQGV
jgi:DNA polymerase-3 subunit epsilon